MLPAIFVHTNDQQLVGALVAAHSMKIRSRHADRFEAKTIRLEETPHLLKRQGQTYQRKGRVATWRNEDLQSFSPLRRMVPQLMGFRGRALVVDPDVFAVGDVHDLLSRDMDGKAIMCRYVGDGYRANGQPFYASSVMLLECDKLEHWDWDADIDRMFDGELDYGPWIGLMHEDPSTIGPLEEAWNSFDLLNDQTQLLHNTERSTQPWKSGLPVDYDLTHTPTKKETPAKGRAKSRGFWSWLLPMTNKHPPDENEKIYLRHPDSAQELFFFELLRDALEKGAVPRRLLQEHINRKFVRADVFQRLREMGWKE